MTTQKLLKKVINVNKFIIEDIKINENDNEIVISGRLPKFCVHHCPVCGKRCSIYDHITEKRRWRFLDIGIYKTYIECDVARVNCKEHGVHAEKVPWARHNSRFSREFEMQCAYLALHLNKKECSKLMRIAWNSVGDILTRVRKDLEPNLNERFNDLKVIGIDETSYQKGHKYITTVVDHIKKRVVYIYEGKSREGLDKFFAKLTAKQRNSIKFVTGDGAKWIAACVKDNCPKAEFCIDKFHVMERVIEAMDESRRDLWRELKAFRDAKVEKGKWYKSDETVLKLDEYENIKKAGKYAMGKNPENLTKRQKEFIKYMKQHPKLYNWYLLKEELRLLLSMKDPEKAKIELKDRYKKASHSSFDAIKNLSKKIQSRFDQIINTIKYGLSNALIESFNNKCKCLQRKAYGFRNIENLKDLIYISCSNLYYDIKPAYE